MASRAFAFHLSETRVVLHTELDPVRRGMEAVWSSCKEPVVAARSEHHVGVNLEGEAVVIRVDGETFETTPRVFDALPLADGTLYRCLPAWAGPGRALLHAALLVGADAGLLIAGESEAGKSSLAFEGMRRGFAYGGDEVCVSDGLRIWGVPRAILYDPTHVANPLPPWIADAECASYSLVNTREQRCFVPLRRPPAESVFRSILHLRDVHLVLAQRGERDELQAISPLEALGAVYRERWGDTQVDLSALARAAGCFRLTWTCPRTAAALLEHITRPRHTYTRSQAHALACAGHDGILGRSGHD